MARVRYLNRGDLTPEGQAAHDRIMKRRTTMSRPWQAMLHSPRTAAIVAGVMEHLRLDVQLDAALKEITILTVCRELRNEFEFTHHMRIAREAGFRQELLGAIRYRRQDGLTADERLWTGYIRQVLAGKVSDESFASVARRLGDRGAVDLTAFVGGYAMLCHILNALGVELEEGAEPLLPR